MEGVGGRVEGVGGRVEGVSGRVGREVRLEQDWSCEEELSGARLEL